MKSFPIHVYTQEEQNRERAAHKREGPLLKLGVNDVRGLAMMLGFIACILAFLWWLGIDLPKLESTTGNNGSEISEISQDRGEFFSIRATVQSGGKVVEFQNTKDKVIRNVVIACQDSTTNTSRSFNVEAWSPGQVIELGKNNSWNLASGQVISFEADGYQRMTITLK